MRNYELPLRNHPRRAAALYAALLIVAAGLGSALALVRVAVLVCHRATLQVEADRVALAMGDALAEKRQGTLATVSTVPGPITIGQWDTARRRFLPGRHAANAVEVIAQGGVERISENWLARLCLPDDRWSTTRAVAVVQPRDIVFVVDLSASMTAGSWAALEPILSSVGEPLVPLGDHQLQSLYSDLGFREYPGPMEPFGAPWPVIQGRQAYTALTAADGPLAHPATNRQWRIEANDPLATRRKKAYRAVIENQVVRLMPQAEPAPQLAENFDYWAEYLDEVLASDDPDARIGYPSYLKFVLDHGRAIRAGGRHVLLSQHSSDCPWHEEIVGGLACRFPPRTQPMHRVRLGLVTILQNLMLPSRTDRSVARCDRAAIVSVDALCTGGAWIEQGLTSDFGLLVDAASRLQAVGGRVPLSTAISGLELAEQTLSESDGAGGAARIVVLISANRPWDETAVRMRIAEMNRRGWSVRVVAADWDKTEIQGDFERAVGPSSAVIVR